MSFVIKPISFVIDFVRISQKENREAGSRGGQVDLLLNEMHATTKANQKQIMAPSPLKEVLEAGAKGSQVQMVLDEMEKVTKDAQSSRPSAHALKKLNII